jgi:hypothetical protein
MGWKSRASLDKIEFNLDEDGVGNLSIGLRDIDEVPNDAEPITFDAFMDLMETSMGVEDGLGNDERVRGNEQDEKKSWSDARKRVDVNALFRN